MLVSGKGIKCGIAIGKVFKFEQPELDIQKKALNSNDELVLFNNGLIKTNSDLILIKNRANKLLNNDVVSILDAQLAMSNDPVYINMVKDEILKGFSAAYACKEISKQYNDALASIDNDYLKERQSDIESFTHRLISNILNIEIADLSSIHEKVIVVAKDISAQDTILLNKEYILGFVIENSSETSHSSILLKSLNIPTVVSVNNIFNNVNNSDEIIVDSNTGEVIINPNDKEIVAYQKEKDELDSQNEELEKIKKMPSTTKDNHHISLMLNITSIDEAAKLNELNAEGVGLFRTEFLYMNSINHFPEEEEQYNVYSNILKMANFKPVTIRTLDIGGDKNLNYYTFPKQDNPFLGYRSIRFSLDQKDIFKVQIRALLKASVFGKLQIMFPMITNVDEFIEAKEFVQKQKEELIKEGYKVDPDIKIGMMIETPSSCLMANTFGIYADFFSIGTNDLTQYGLACDRLSSKVSYLYEPLNPAILKLIKLAVDGAHNNGITCSVCGEMASDKDAFVLLMGLGVDSLSIVPNKLLQVKNKILNSNKTKAEKLALEALEKETTNEVKKLIKEA